MNRCSARSDGIGHIWPSDQQLAIWPLATDILSTAKCQNTTKRNDTTFEMRQYSCSIWK